jgi:chromosome segregation ATPase
LVRNNQDIKRDHKDISSENKALANDHKEILSKGNKLLSQQTQIGNTIDSKFSLLDKDVEQIKGSLEKTEFRINNMNSSERDVQNAIDTVTRFLERSQTTRSEKDKKYQELVLKYNDLVESYNSVLGKNKVQATRIKELEQKITELTPKPPRKNYDGPSFDL